MFLVTVQNATQTQKLGFQERVPAGLPHPALRPLYTPSVTTLLHEARLPLTYSPALQVVVNTAQAFSIEQSQEGIRYVIEEAGDGFSSAACGNLK